jgi:hypothetical protein
MSTYLFHSIFYTLAKFDDIYVTIYLNNLSIKVVTCILPVQKKIDSELFLLI